MDKNITNFLKSLPEYFRFPGLLIIGIFLFFFSILRFNHWALIDIMLLAGIGLVIIFLGIILYFTNLKVMTVVGGVLSGIALSIFYLVDRRITDVVAISYSFGMIVLLLDIMGAIKNRPINTIKMPYGLMPKPDFTYTESLEDRYTNTVSSGLQNLQEILIGYRIAIAEEKTKIKASVEEKLLKMLEFNDGFESYLDKFKNSEQKPEGFIQIKKMYDELQETLEMAHVRPMEEDIGETIDEKKHEMINVINKPPSEDTGKPAIIQVRKKGYYIDSPVLGRILRRAKVEVGWKSDTDVNKKQL